jgi:hypothetical protein
MINSPTPQLKSWDRDSMIEKIREKISKLIFFFLKKKPMSYDEISKENK